MDPTVKKYTGQKNIPGLFQQIINHIPGHKVIIELFAGSAAISRHFVGNSEIILNDLDQEVTAKYKVPGATVICQDALDLLQSEMLLSAGKETFVFLDPPYLFETRANENLYIYEMTAKQHHDLLYAIKKLSCNVMIVHPDVILYNRILADWQKVQIKVRYHNKTSIENLYMNYPSPGTLQSYQFVGNDCWDRQRIKRKGDRLIKKLQTLPLKEKNYLLNRIQVELLTKSNQNHD